MSNIIVLETRFYQKGDQVVKVEFRSDHKVEISQDDGQVWVEGNLGWVNRYYPEVVLDHLTDPVQDFTWDREPGIEDLADELVSALQELDPKQLYFLRSEPNSLGEIALDFSPEDGSRYILTLAVTKVMPVLPDPGNDSVVVGRRILSKERIFRTGHIVEANHRQKEFSIFLEDWVRTSGRVTWEVHRAIENSCNEFGSKGYKLV